MTSHNVTLAWLVGSYSKKGEKWVVKKSRKKDILFNDLITKKQFNEIRNGERTLTTKTVDQLEKACKARDD